MWLRRRGGSFDLRALRQGGRGGRKPRLPSEGTGNARRLLGPLMAALRQCLARVRIVVPSSIPMPGRHAAAAVAAQVSVLFANDARAPSEFQQYKLFDMLDRGACRTGRMRRVSSRSAGGCRGL